MHCCGNVKWCTHSGNEFRGFVFLLKLSRQLPYNSAIEIFSSYLREMKKCSYKELYIKIHISFTLWIAPDCKRPSYPSIRIWLLAHVSHGKLLLNKINKLQVPKRTWMNVQVIMLNEKSQSKTLHTVWFHLYKHF